VKDGKGCEFHKANWEEIEKRGKTQTESKGRNGRGGEIAMKLTGRSGWMEAKL